MRRLLTVLTFIVPMSICSFAFLCTFCISWFQVRLVIELCAFPCLFIIMSIDWWLCLLQEKERQFELDIRRVKGLEVKRMVEDGNCLFRAVADQVYGDSEAYDLTRQMCIDYMVGSMNTCSHLSWDFYIWACIIRWSCQMLF